ncbi:MAG: glycosyltransferase [Candidatus Moranbacteria bacterium]|nr:glycosyltransferase [Candidatus Moranbacteria bacterium]
MDSKKKIRIAIVAPPFGNNGGPEIVAQNLTDALLEIGVDVTFFAPADFITNAKHVHTLPVSLWKIKDFKNQSKEERRNLRIKSQMEVLKYQKDFDIVHLHSQKYAHLVGELIKKPCVLTFHNKIEQLEFEKIKKTGIFTVSLSETHGNGLELSAIIPNGIPVENINPSFEKGKYLIAIGRLTESKGIDIAIKIAKKAQKKLYIFGRIGDSLERQQYFNEKIKPLLDENIIYKGEVSQKEIFEYLKNAEALISPIRRITKVCPLTVIESLACGTPVIGSLMNPTPEILQDNSIACLSGEMDVLVDAARNIERFDRKKCRKVAETYFSNIVMAKKYLELYEKILKA